MSPAESPRPSLDQAETPPPPQQQQQQQSRAQNGTRLTTAISAVSVSSDDGPVASAPVDDLLTQYSSLYSSPRASRNHVVSGHGSDSLPAAGHVSATAEEVAAVAAAFGDYDATGAGSHAEARPDAARQPSTALSPFAPARGGSGSGSSASPESPKLTNRRLESVIKPPRHSKRRRCVASRS